MALSFLALAAGGCGADDHAYKVPGPWSSSAECSRKLAHAARVPYQLTRLCHIPGSMPAQAARS